MSSANTLKVPAPGGRSFDVYWASDTHTGYHRVLNEDSFNAAPPMWVVADGMGGHECGDIASQTVTTHLADISGDLVNPEDIVHQLRRSVISLAEQVGKTELGAGTTVTGVALWEKDGKPAWLVLNLGDSRVYCLQDGEINQLTEDHSIVREMVKSGQITSEEAAVHPYSNIITRAVGFNSDPVPDFSYILMRPGMRLIVCSDGLNKELTDEQIATYGGAGSVQDAAASLVREALVRGGHDNVTVVVLDVMESAAAQSE